MIPHSNAYNKNYMTIDHTHTAKQPYIQCYRALLLMLNRYIYNFKHTITYNVCGRLSFSKSRVQNKLVDIDINTQEKSQNPWNI